MAELIDVIGKIDIDELPGDLNDQEEVNKMFKDKLGDNFDKFFGGKLELSFDGAYSSAGDPRRVINLKEYREFSSVEPTDPYNSTGRTIKKFKSLGFTDSEIGAGGTDLEDFCKKQDKSMLETPPAKDFQDAYNAGKESGKKPVPKSAADVDKKTEDSVKDAVKDKDKNSSIGKWVKTAGIIGALAAGGVALFEAVKHHQDAMNGCWIMNMTTGDKCKITQLTCDKNAQIAVDGSGCNLCLDITNQQTCGPLSFDPCPIGGKAIAGSTDPFPNYGSNCDKNVASYYCKDSDTNMCKNCDSTIYNLIGNSKMICVNVDWSGALEDIIGKPADEAVTGLTNTIFNILKWVGIGLVCLLILYIIYRLTKFETTKSDATK